MWLPAGRDVHCPVCLQIASYPVETNCGHIFCGACVNRLQTTSLQKKIKKKKLLFGSQMLVFHNVA